MENSSSAASPANSHELAAWLRALLGDRSIRNLARELETDRSNVYRWFGVGRHEDSPTEPGGVWLLKILTALGVTLTPPPPEVLAGDRPLLESLAAMVERQNRLIEELTARLELQHGDRPGPSARAGR